MGHALPVIDPDRVEFGFARTICACNDCTAYCRQVPGYLIPADLERLRQQVAVGDFQQWASQHLLASPGALVMQRGKLFRIQTIVPARQTDGACVFLTPESRCAIHALAPFGCAFFDSHQTADEADRRSSRGLRAILEDWIANGPYAQLWTGLHAAGRVAQAPENLRSSLLATQQQTQPIFNHGFRKEDIHGGFPGRDRQ
jgi:hypothetical protein